MMAKSSASTSELALMKTTFAYGDPMTCLHYAAVKRRTLCLAAGIALLALAACGGGTSGEPAGATYSVANVDANVAINPGASLFGLSKIAVAHTGTDASDISVAFHTAQDPPQPLVPDLASPGQFWLPVVVAPVAGALSISAPDRASVAMPLTLTPFAAPDAPGVATRDFLQDSLSNTDAAIRDVLADQPLPDLLQALNSTMAMTQQELNWVTKAMQSGSTIMATRKNGTPVKMTTDDLRALDQMVLHTEAARTGQGTAPPAAWLPSWIKVIDFLIPNAFAQTSDSAAFISGTKAIGDGLGLTANLAPGAAGTDAFLRGADAQAISLNMAGLYAAHYGNALATIQMLPNLTFREPVDKVQLAVRALFAGIINEIFLPDLDSLTQDISVGLVSKFIGNVDNAAVENIVMDNVIIFTTRSVGSNLCPANETAVADPNVDSVRCVSL
jgi:hypothetical protein